MPLLFACNIFKVSGDKALFIFMQQNQHFLREGLVSLSDDVEGAAAAKSKKSSQKKDVKRLPSANTSDDIDKMKVSTATLILLNI